MSKYEVNGFVFSPYGELLEKPSVFSEEILNDTLKKLYRRGRSIAASRIEHSINSNYLFN